MKKTLFLLTLLLGTTLYANEIQCKEDGSQMQMNKCAYEDFKKADKELNQVYKAVKEKRQDDKIYLRNLKISQRFWIKFRNAELNLIFSCKDEELRLCFGSMYPLLYNTEKAYLTRQRIKNLTDYLTEEEF